MPDPIPALPSKFQRNQQVRYSGVPQRSNPCTILAVTFWTSGVVTYSVRLNNDPGGQRHNVAESDLSPVE